MKNKTTTDAKKCKKCGVCDKKCPMSLSVESMVITKKMEHADCVLCGSCVDNCRSNAINFSFQPVKK